MEVTDHHRIRVRAGHSADNVERVVNVGHPITHRLVERVFKRAGTRFDGNHGRPEQLHSEHVGRLALDIINPHVHHTLHPVARADCCGRHAVLARTGFSDDAFFTHTPRQQSLTEAVVDFVSTRVV